LSIHVKLAEVAERAGVSTATVSRFLNGRHVKAAAHGRIRQAIEELNYQPNLAARELAGGKSRTIGVIVSNVENPFFFDIYRTLEDDARHRGYEVVMANTDYRAEQLAASVRLMIGRRVAGLAAIVSELEPAVLDELCAARVPTVFFDVGKPRPGVTKVRVDYSAGMKKAVTYLHSLGHRRLGFLGHHDPLGPLQERRKAVLSAAARYSQLQVASAEGSDTLEGGRLAMSDLLASGFNPTAVTCVNDIIAVGALRALRDRGLRVPEDISVMGFDDIKLAEFSYPSLTSVHVPRDRIGHIMFEQLMLESDKSTTAGREIVIEPELRVRNSTGPAAEVRT
jgi:LacI family transcriptional regulator